MNATRLLWHERYGNANPKIVCVGLNYRDHAEESGFQVPNAPLFFAKFANALCGDGDAIVLPEEAEHVDAEAELAIVIGSFGHNISSGHALDIVDGYTCANDVSARDLQFHDGQWFRGKGYDTFSPVGPRVVQKSELRDTSNLRVSQRLNGEVLQDSSTSGLIFSVPELVARASRIVSLERGDLILTGTPNGVGWFREPRIALAPGDIVEIEVEGIGILTNTVAHA
jgi:2-keto-4-pentenoate hydratase/2-oxohepta-3-ene-1,7-dioic acid hydratase in catechol pathway